VIQYKFIQSSEHHEFDWEVMEQAGLQSVPAAELEESAIMLDGMEQEEDESELPGPVGWEAWKAHKRMCAPL